MNTGRFFKSAVLALIFLTILSACGTMPEGSSSFNRSPNGKITDPLFGEFEAYLDSIIDIGPPISNTLPDNGLNIQYFETVAMIYDPSAAPTERYQLAPLGRELLYFEAPEGNPLPGDLVVNGYIIYPQFAPLYLKLGGERFVGLPLTNAHYNEENDRWEQQFENMGFYFSASDPSQTIHLINYGLAACGTICQGEGKLDDSIRPSQSIPDPFASGINRLGRPFTGLTLINEPFIASDGYLELILENMVMYQDPENATRIFARPMVLMLGVQPQDPVARLPIDAVYFYVVEGSLGYNIPLFFYEYLSLHGGLDISGPPISELFEVTPGIYRQCFENLCLNYDATLPEDLAVSVVPLGQEYKNKFYNPESATPNNAATETALSTSFHLQVWEESTTISSAQQQVIHAMTFLGHDPLPNMHISLTIQLPDGSRQEYLLPVTSEIGLTTVTLDPIQAENGSLIIYEVCTQYAGLGDVCQSNSFVIWGN